MRPVINQEGDLSTDGADQAQGYALAGTERARPEVALPTERVVEIPVRLRSLLSIMICLCVSHAALAAGVGENGVDPTLRDEGRALYVAAVKDIDAGRWGEARAKLLEAWRLFPHWSISGNLAQCELELGRFRDAAEHAAHYAANAPADRHDKATALLNRALARVGKLAITAEPAGAELLVDR